MRNRTRLLIRWALLASAPLTWVACGGREEVDFPDDAAGASEGGPDAREGGGGSVTGGRGGADGSSGAAGSGGGGASGKGGAAGVGGASGKGGAAGKGGSGGSAGTAGRGGSGGSAGTAGSGGTAGSSGSSGSAGSSGASGSDAGDGSTDGRVDGSIDASEDASTPDASAPDASTPDASAPDASMPDASTGDASLDVAFDSGDAGCPDVLGTYAINNANGNCGDLDDNAFQEIRSPGQACSLDFISMNEGGPGVAINGGAPLGADGTFSGATLTMGTATRSPCTGSWSEVEQEFTVVCGNAGDECLVELRRTGP